MGEPVEMPFGGQTQVVPVKRVLDGGFDPPWKESILWGVFWD